MVGRSTAWDLKALEFWGKEAVETGGCLQPCVSAMCRHAAEVARGKCWEPCLKNGDPQASEGEGQV